MSVKVKPVVKLLPNASTDSDMHYALQSVNKGVVDLDQLADDISLTSTLSPADCYAITHSFV